MHKSPYVAHISLMYFFFSISSCLCTPLAPIFISHMTSLNSFMSILNNMNLWHMNFKRTEKVSGKWPKGKCFLYDCATAVAILSFIIVVFSRDFLRRLCEKDMGQQVWKRVREMKEREKVKGKRDKGEREMESLFLLYQGGIIGTSCGKTQALWALSSPPSRCPLHSLYPCCPSISLATD